MHCIRKLLCKDVERFREFELSAKTFDNENNENSAINKNNLLNKGGWLYIVRCAGWQENVYKFGICVQETLNQRLQNYQQSGFRNAQVISAYLCTNPLVIESHLKLHLFGYHMAHSMETVCMPLPILQQTIESWLMKNQLFSEKITRYIGEEFTIYQLVDHDCETMCKNINQLPEWHRQFKWLNGYKPKCSCQAYPSNLIASHVCGIHQNAEFGDNLNQNAEFGGNLNQSSSDTLMHIEANHSMLPTLNDSELIEKISSLLPDTNSESSIAQQSNNVHNSSTGLTFVKQFTVDDNTRSIDEPLTISSKSKKPNIDKKETVNNKEIIGKRITRNSRIKL